MNHRHTFQALSQSDIALKIEGLVEAVERSEGPVQSQSASGKIRRSKLARHFESIDQMLDLVTHNDDYRYGPHLRVFKQACYDIGLERSSLEGIVSIDEEAGRYRDYSETINLLADRIRQLTRGRGYHRRRYDQYYQWRMQRREVAKYVDQVLDRYATTLVVRVDLYYRSAAHARLRIEHVFADLSRLIRSREHDPVFEHYTGYVCGIEQGDLVGGRGFHAHLAFFFNGAKVRGDIYKAHQIGELWEEITCGRGSYNSCNHGKEKRYGLRSGVGMFHRDDAYRRNHVHEAISYLIKDEQQLRLRPRGGRALRKGQPIRL